jgi:hypothetical protein
MKDKGWLKVKSAAQWGDVSVKTIRAGLDQGLPHSRVGGLIQIKREHQDPMAGVPPGRG